MAFVFLEGGGVWLSESESPLLTESFVTAMMLRKERCPVGTCSVGG